MDGLEFTMKTFEMLATAILGLMLIAIAAGIVWMPFIAYLVWGWKAAIGYFMLSVGVAGTVQLLSGLAKQSDK
jgi:hypothetical protein